MTPSESPEYRRLRDELAQAQDDANRQLEQAQRRHSHRRRGDYYWIADLAMITIGAAGFGMWAWLVPNRAMRRRIGHSAFA